jgi:hypothetical protein
MERSKGIILVIAGLAAVLIVWKVAFKPVPEEKTPADPNKTTTSTQPGASAAASSRRPGPQPDESGPEQDQYSRTRPGRGGDNNFAVGGRNSNLPEASFRIVIPDDISDTELRSLADAYMQILSSGRGGRMGGRTRGGGGFGGMGGGGGFGGFGG